MSGQLDLLLDAWRSDDPVDDGFTASVMAQVRTEKARETGRTGPRGLRRPMVMGVVAAIVVTGGAVAAVVGSNPLAPKAAPVTERPRAAITSQAPVNVTDAPAASAADKQTTAPVARTATPAGKGYATDHLSYIVDPKTGLMLRTETYTNEFTVDKPQRITLTLENTGRDPISFTASDGCALQVMAYAADDANADGDLFTQSEGRFEWVCAGSDADPRVQTFGDTFLLAPGERKVADAFVSLPQTGAWSVSGMCRCEYRTVKPTPVPKSDPLGDLTQKAFPSPLLPDQPDGRNLVSPPIGVRAR